MQILIADKAGFCAGVRRAFHIAEEAGRSDCSWCTLGPLVHNDGVIRYFEQKGIKAIDVIDDVDKGGVIIRTHGVPPQIIQKASAKGFLIQDATCPLVKRVHEVAELLRGEGYDIVIFGDKDHPEVQGIMGWCDNKATIIANPDEACDYAGTKKLGVISQTTKDEKDYFAVVSALISKSHEIRVFNTICSATRQRQESARKLCQEVDLMLVIGDQCSSNTQTLTRECQQTGVKTWQIQSAADIKTEYLEGVKRLGITAGASTPDWIIKEVLDRMTEFGDGGAPQEQKQEELVQENQVQENLNEESFAKMEAEMADLATPEKGDVIKGIVIQVLDDEVMVDVGGKSEGIIPLREMSFKDVDSAKELAKIGDEIEVLVLKWDDDGTILLSKKKVDSKRAMDELEESFNQGSQIEGTVVDSVKGGLLVDVGAIAFLPASHVEDGYVKNLDEYIGKTFSFRIIEFNRHKKRGSQIVLSRKQLVEAERLKLKEQFWSSIEEGQTIKGRVKRIVDYGAFIDLGGFEGLLHVSEMDHVRVNHPSSILSEGEEIDIYILALDREKQRVSLSRKKLIKSPWEIVLEKYEIGDTINGKVVRIAPFGAFVEIEPGVDGLVHISQLANRRVEKPQDVVAIDQEVQVKILSIDPEEKRIGLSIKEVVTEADNQEVQDFMEKQDQALEQQADTKTPAEIAAEDQE
ncbi:MAG: bifunctional 4-hydroxy-3-methylbut-2-enyl diphosphate reductase/30S ribosomal protein S1 [Syntrophomonas sp.]|nr:bifunctional 4-hydroxy-3-methylbut-2-enyl diphosphate reductase/30S ribosomal protein S1 [Syntrophomonas sp.]